MRNYKLQVKQVLTTFALFAIFATQVDPLYAQEDTPQPEKTSNEDGKDSSFESSSTPVVHFVLTKEKVEGGYMVHAKSLNVDNSVLKDGDYNRISYTWRIKTPTKLFKPIRGNIQDVFVPMDGEIGCATVTLIQGECQNCVQIPMTITINPKDLYYVYNQEMLVKPDGLLLDDEKNKYDYNTDKIYLKYLPEITDEARSLQPEKRKIKVYSPFSELREYNINVFEINLKTFVTKDEFEAIRQGNPRKTYTYILFIYDDNEEMIQKIPITFTPKR